MILLFLLFVSMVMGHLVNKARINFLHEAGIATMLGIAFSGFLELIGESSELAPVTNLNVDFFLLFLLPPIIFESGYNMDKKPFFKNFGGIMMYAFCGTFISALFVGLVIYAFGFVSGVTSLSLSESFAFGALISATDPVSVLAIMKDMQTDKTLYNLIFGESIFNDAVTIVLYHTIIRIKDHDASAEMIFLSIGFFFLIFIGSFVIGVGTALLVSYILKKLNIYNPNNRKQLEATSVIFGPWISYLLSEALTLSGIVSILFCGIFMARYTYPNLSESVKELVGSAY
jgi:sodium/hydrogen exchanger 8